MRFFGLLCLLLGQAVAKPTVRDEISKEIESIKQGFQLYMDAVDNKREKEHQQMLAEIRESYKTQLDEIDAEIERIRAGSFHQ